MMQKRTEKQWLWQETCVANSKIDICLPKSVFSNIKIKNLKINCKMLPDPGDLFFIHCYHWGFIIH